MTLVFIIAALILVVGVAMLFLAGLGLAALAAMLIEAVVGVDLS